MAGKTNERRQYTLKNILRHSFKARTSLGEVAANLANMPDTNPDKIKLVEQFLSSIPSGRREEFERILRPTS